MKKRTDGRYCATVMTNGKRHYFYGTTKREADDKAAEFRARIRKGFEVDEDQTFDFWAHRWLTVKAFDVSDKFLAQYRTTVERLCARFRGCTLNDIKPYSIQEYIIELAERNPTTGRPASRRMLELIKQTVSQIYSYAIQNRVTEFNPAVGVVIPRSAPQGSRRALTPQEIAWIDALPDLRLKPAVMIMLYAGLRRGEVIPLRWDDINLEERYIEVNKAVEFPDNVHSRIKTTKTKNGMRRVYFGDRLKKYLEGIDRTSDFVCPSASGEMMSLSSFTRGWESVLAELNVISGEDKTVIGDEEITRSSRFDPRFNSGVVINNLTPHMLRHTFCTMMYEAGVDIMTAKQQMGHASIETTLQIYTHLSEARQKEEAKKLL